MKAVLFNTPYRIRSQCKTGLGITQHMHMPRKVLREYPYRQTILVRPITYDYWTELVAEEPQKYAD